MGLGGYSKASNSLKLARMKVMTARMQLSAGIDPLEHAKTTKSEESAQKVELARRHRMDSMTFAQCAIKYIEANEAEWTIPKHRQQWRNTLTTYANPHIGSLPVNDIELHDVEKCLNPI